MVKLLPDGLKGARARAVRGAEEPLKRPRGVPLEAAVNLQLSGADPAARSPIG